MKLKQILAASAAISILVGNIPVFAAYSTITFDEATRNYFITRSYEDGVLDNTVYSCVGDIVDDPDASAEDNHALKITTAAGGNLAQGKYQYVFSDISKRSYVNMGADGSKKLYSSADFYFPSEMLNELGEGNALNIGLPLYEEFTGNLLEGLTIKKTAGADTFTLTHSSGTSVVIQPNTWFNIKYEWQMGESALKIYYNDEQIVSKNIAGWIVSETGPYDTGRRCMALKVNTTAQCLTGGFYVDNVALYEYADQELTLSMNDGATDVDGAEKITASCAAQISAADFAGKVTAEDSNGNKFTAMVTQEDKNTVGFTFSGLADETEYTLKIEDLTSGEATVLGKEIKFTTKKAEFMFITSDLADGAEIKPGDYTIKLSLSQEFSLEELKSCLCVKDEDENDITYTVRQNEDKSVSVEFSGLDELTGYILRIDKALTSLGGLPLVSEFVLNFRTLEKGDDPIEDPYFPETNNDKVILSQEDLETKSWYISNPSLGSVSVESDENGNYIKLHVDSSSNATTFKPNAKTQYDQQESGSAKYALDNMLVFEYEVKYPDISKISTANVSFTSHPNDESKAENKDTGTWGSTLVNQYSVSTTGLRTMKNGVGSTAVAIKKASEITDEWIKMKSAINTKTGEVWVFMPDGTINKTTINMHDSPGWGSDDKYADWGKYMYISGVGIALLPSKDDGADMYIRNFSVKRITNTLSVEKVNFNYGDCYVDVSDIQLEFNDDIDLSALDGCVYITDTDGNKVDCEITIAGGNKNFNVSVNGLKPYTSYYLTVDGAVAKSQRNMPKKFERLFTTKKSSKIFVDTQDENAVLNTYGKKLSKADKLDYTVVLKSEDSSTADLIGAVAVYGKEDKLLAIKYDNLQLGNNKFQLTDIPGGAVSVKVYAWHIENGLISGLLHEPDSLQPSEKSEYTLNKTKTLPQFTAEIADNIKSIVGISGKTEDKDAIYTVAVLKGKDTPLSEIQDKTALLSYAAVENGEYSSNAELGEVSGTYTAYVITADGAYSYNFEYIKLEDLVNEYIKKIADGTIAKDQIYSKTAAYNAGIGIDFNSDFVSERDKNLFNKRMYERRALLKGPSNTEYAQQLYANIQFARDEIKYLNELSSITYYGLIREKLDKGIEFTKIDFTKYGLLSNTKQSTVQAALVGKTFKDGDEVKEFFDAQVESAASAVVNPGQSGTGGGGNGGGSNLNNMINTDKKEITADDVFNDLSNHSWAKDAILNLSKRGIVNGVEKDKFDPSGFVTREQFVKMAVLAMDIYNENGVAEFDDIAPGAWYGTYIASAKQKNLVNGISDVNFGVGRNITREDVAVIIYRMFEQKSIKLTKTKDDFDDMKNISDYAYAAVSALAGEGIINGVGNNKFSPKSNTTRAEAAVLINAFMKGVN